MHLTGGWKHYVIHFAIAAIWIAEMIIDYEQSGWFWILVMVAFVGLKWAAVFVARWDLARRMSRAQSVL